MEGILPMSLDFSGQNARITGGVVKVRISSKHPLIRLAIILPWVTMVTLITEDLKRSTTKGFWMLGRRLMVRIHLGI